MEWINQINDVIDYLEMHMEQKVDYEQAAKIACCSEYHLSRLFTSVAGVSMSEYVRRRRLTKAAYDLQNEGIRVLDVALKYGYESADAFSRAFKKLHGIRPSDAKHMGAGLCAYPKLSIELMVKGEAAIKYRIEEVVEDLLIIGVSKPLIVDEAEQSAPMMWHDLSTKGVLGGFVQAGVACGYASLDGLLGVYEKIVSRDVGVQENTYLYTIGVRLNDVMACDVRDKLTEFDYRPHTVSIPAGRWLVFTDLSEVRKRLFTEWIPTLGYKVANQPFIECVKGIPPKVEASLWVPILSE